jgi:hypothetical protein
MQNVPSKTHSHIEAVEPHRALNCHEGKMHNKQAIPQSLNTTPHTILPTHLIAKIVPDNVTHKNQHHKLWQNTKRTHKPQHTIINASTHNDASMKPHHKINAYILINRESSNPITKTIVTSPLAPRIPCSERTSSSTLI